MSGGPLFDAAVIGGGLSGGVTALFLARGGMRVALIDKRGLAAEASGVNAGTLSVQVKEAALVRYAMRSNELWETSAEWLGFDMGFRRLGGLTIAITDEEVALLKSRMDPRIEAGAPITYIGGNQAREIEPALCERIAQATYCPLDGYANSTQVGPALRAGLIRAGVDVMEGKAVTGVDRDGGDWVLRREGGDPVRARRIVLATGVWLSRLLPWFGFELDVDVRVNQVSVTERRPPLLRTIVGFANGFLSLKQVANGTLLIGGGWQGIGDMDQGGVRPLPDRVLGNMRLARFAVPGVRDARVVRTWLGVEGHSPGYIPMVGDLPGHEDAFVVGLVRGGFTIGPLADKLMAEHILGREPEMPIFDPAKLLGPGAAKREAAA